MWLDMKIHKFTILPGVKMILGLCGVLGVADTWESISLGLTREDKPCSRIVNVNALNKDWGCKSTTSRIWRISEIGFSAFDLNEIAATFKRADRCAYTPVNKCIKCKWFSIRFIYFF